MVEALLKFTFYLNHWMSTISSISTKAYHKNILCFSQFTRYNMAKGVEILHEVVFQLLQHRDFIAGSHISDLCCQRFILLPSSPF